MSRGMPGRTGRTGAALALLAAALLLLTGTGVGPSLAALAAPSAANAAECAGDECEAPPPAPEDPTPGTAVAEGPSNPPVRFPGHHGKKHHKNKTSHGKKRHRKRPGARR